MKIAETERLIVRWINLGDAEFILDLLNEPSWIMFIGDRGIRTLGDAKRYISEGPMLMYKQFGFGLYLVELKGKRTPIGLCGLIKRESLENVDIGFAFLEEYGGKGYAFESAKAVLIDGRDRLGLTRIVAITSEANVRSAHLLEKLGLSFEKMIVSEDESLKLYSVDF